MTGWCPGTLGALYAALTSADVVSVVADYFSQRLADMGNATAIDFNSQLLGLRKLLPASVDFQLIDGGEAGLTQLTLKRWLIARKVMHSSWRAGGQALRGEWAEVLASMHSEHVISSVYSIVGLPGL